MNESLHSFITTFSDEKYGAATYISELADSYGVQAFADTVYEILSASENEESLFCLNCFLRFVFRYERYIPGRWGTEIQQLFETSSAFKDVYLGRLRLTASHFLMTDFLHTIDTMRGVFDAQERKVLFLELLSRNPFVSMNVLEIARANEDVEAYIRFILDSKNTYMIWGLLQYWIEHPDDSANPYLGELETIEDIAVKERLKYFKTKCGIIETMFEENRIEFTEEETEALGKSVFDYFAMIERAHDPVTGLLKPWSDIDREKKSLWMSQAT